jgi:uncharacterized membrane protein YdbT with pleckstrin-like domain
MEANEKLILEVKPNYKIIHGAIKRFWDIVLFTILIIIIISKVGINHVAIISLIIFILGYLVYLLITKRKYKKYYYKFYENKLVYRSSIWSRKGIEILYSDIKEIKYFQTFTQKRFNIGDIQIVMFGMNILKKVLFMQYVENPKETYEKIAQIFK